MRSLAHWAAIALILAFTALGLNGAIHEVDSVNSVGQRAATATQFGYALVGLVAAGALLMRRSWARQALWLWAGLITITGAMAPVVWGGAGVATGLAAGVTTAAIAALVMWLAGRQRVALERPDES